MEQVAASKNHYGVSHFKIGTPDCYFLDFWKQSFAIFGDFVYNNLRSGQILASLPYSLMLVAR